MPGEKLFQIYFPLFGQYFTYTDILSLWLAVTWIKSEGHNISLHNQF